MSESFTFATSLVPGSRQEIQQRAVASWRKLGAKVLSFNREREIPALIPDFPGVVFCDPKRDAAVQTGKPLIYLADILNHLVQTESGPFGLVNSDIQLDPPAGFLDRMGAEAQGALVVTTRVEIETPDSRVGKRNLSGFDAMFLDADVAARMTDYGFCLGMPFWDYWMPMTAAISGMPFKQITTDVAYHPSHEVAWSDKQFLFSDMYVRFLQDEIAKAGAASLVETPAFIFLQGYFSYYYNKIQARLLARTSPDFPPDEKFHVAAQFAEFTDALNETTSMFMRRQARQIAL